ncbi:MAG TPA: hypothetical protein ENK12_12390 [Gammaproteobacteria bacterium]|nr:hypothetical protein [Gammaproteobacteria bacterium]
MAPTSSRLNTRANVFFTVGFSIRCLLDELSHPVGAGLPANPAQPGWPVRRPQRFAGKPAPTGGDVSMSAGSGVSEFPVGMQA